MLVKRHTAKGWRAHIVERYSEREAKSANFAKSAATDGSSGRCVVTSYSRLPKSNGETVDTRAWLHFRSQPQLLLLLRGTSRSTSLGSDVDQVFRVSRVVCT